MDNAEFSKNYVFAVYKRFKYNHTDNSKNQGSPSNFVALMLKGSAVLKTKKVTIDISEGEVFFIPKGELYQSFWYGDENGDIEFLSLGAQNLPISESVPIQKLDCTPRARGLLNYFLDDLNVNCKTVGLYYSFLGEVFLEKKASTSHYGQITEKAVHYMYANLNSRTKDVAQYCDVSEATLYNAFAKKLKKTPNEVRQQILCEKAENLLTTTTLSVEEICSMLHFSSSSYFRKVLKKHTGKNPSMIRKENSI